MLSVIILAVFMLIGAELITLILLVVTFFLITAPFSTQRWIRILWTAIHIGTVGAGIALLVLWILMKK